MSQEGSVAILIVLLIIAFFVAKKAFKICFALWHKWNVENVANDTLAAWERYENAPSQQKSATVGYFRRERFNALNSRKA